jgi:hypothetical protein
MNFRDLFIGIMNEINIAHSEELEAGNTFKYTIRTKRNFNFNVSTIIMEIKFKSEEDYRNLFDCNFKKNFYKEGINILDEDFGIENILTLELQTENCIMCSIN